MSLGPSPFPYMIIVRRIDKRCGIFVKFLTNLWRNRLYRRFFGYIVHNFKYINDFFNISTFRQGISTYQQITTKRGCSKRASSFYLLSKFVFDPVLTFYKASCHYGTSVICCYV
ncbi:hypothetical protein CK938_26775 [Bacillus cereus]|nr:hypothetical protein CK938_26775 [Bacillus cereus]